MDYLGGSYKNETFEVITRPSDRKNALIGTFIFTVLLLIIVFWRFFSVLDPLPEPGGLEASFGNVEFAGGSDRDDPKVKPVVEPSPPVKNDKKAEVSDDEKSLKLNEPSKTNSKTSKTSETKTKPAGANADDAFAGNGNTSGNGKVGTDKGKGDLGKIGGGGPGNGKENAEVLSEGKRKCIRNCKDCNTKENWSDKGEAIVDVIIDEDGNVIEAKLASVKTYISNSNFSQAQAKMAEYCAKQKVYEKSGKKTKTTSRITFKYS